MDAKLVNLCQTQFALLWTRITGLAVKILQLTECNTAQRQGKAQRPRDSNNQKTPTFPLRTLRRLCDPSQSLSQFSLQR